VKAVTFEDIKGLGIAPMQCYEWVEEMLRQKDSVVLPPKTHMAPADNVFCNVMPCILPNNFSGVKVVTRYPERKPSLDSRLLLMDASSGEFLALMDANWITAMRTGAVAVHSIRLLAKKNFSVMGMMGLGNTARATMMVLADMLPDRELTVKLLKYKGQEIDFADRFKQHDNIHFVYVDTPEEMVKGSEVIVSAATYLAQNICPDDCFDEGVLVVPVHTRGFGNCDLFFDKVYADDTAHVSDFRYFSKFRKFAEVADVVNGKAPGRENDRERILAYNIGLSIHDINFAGHIYEMIRDRGGLTDIDLKAPTEKFWI